MRVLPKTRSTCLDNINHLVRIPAHPFIVGLQYTFQSSSNFYLAFDYIESGEMIYFLSKNLRFSEACAKFFAAEIICALQYLHSLGMHYGELTPEHIMIDTKGKHVLHLTHPGHIMLSPVSNPLPPITITFDGTPEYLGMCTMYSDLW